MPCCDKELLPPISPLALNRTGQIPKPMYPLFLCPSIRQCMNEQGFTCSPSISDACAAICCQQISKGTWSSWRAVGPAAGHPNQPWCHLVGSRVSLVQMLQQPSTCRRDAIQQSFPAILFVCLAVDHLRYVNCRARIAEESMASNSHSPDAAPQCLPAARPPAGSCGGGGTRPSLSSSTGIHPQ